MFEGHFEEAAILPGVIQVALAGAACNENLSTPRSLKGVRNVKFLRPLRPGDQIELRLAAGQEPESVTFEIRSGKHSATSGLLIFSSDGDKRG